MAPRGRRGRHAQAQGQGRRADALGPRCGDVSRGGACGRHLRPPAAAPCRSTWPTAMCTPRGRGPRLELSVSCSSERAPLPDCERRAFAPQCRASMSCNIPHTRIHSLHACATHAYKVKTHRGQSRPGKSFRGARTATPMSRYRQADGGRAQDGGARLPHVQDRQEGSRHDRHAAAREAVRRARARAPRRERRERRGCSSRVGGRREREICRFDVGETCAGVVCCRSAHIRVYSIPCIHTRQKWCTPESAHT